MAYTPPPRNPSRHQRRGADRLFNKKRARELKAMAADEVRPGVSRFTAAVPRARADGWTAERQMAFIEALADTACVRTAAKEVGMSPRSAYTLRHHPTAYAFRHAWERAIDHANTVMADKRDRAGRQRLHRRAALQG